MLSSLGRIFLILGVIFLIMGGLFYLASRLNIPLGKLPGDIVIQGKNLTCIIPLATSLILSILLTLLLAFFSRFIGRK